MSRAWDEFVAAVFDVVAPGTVLLILLLGAGVTGALWYWFPAWVPRRLPRRRLRLPRWRLPKRHRPGRTGPTVPPEPEPEPVLTPSGPAEDTVEVGGLSLADRLAAEGRYAEAIRQRLRDTLGELVAARLVPPQPGWTAAELATMAAAQRPAVSWPLIHATELFAEVWYGDRPAGHAHDQHMRTLTDQVRAAL